MLLTYNAQWGYLSIFTEIVTWILIGLGICWLISQKSISSTKDIVVELCIILIMNIIVAFLVSPLASLMSFVLDMKYVLGLIIGVEIFRTTKYLKTDRKSNM